MAPPPTELTPTSVSPNESPFLVLVVHPEERTRDALAAELEGTGLWALTTTDIAGARAYGATETLAAVVCGDSFEDGGVPELLLALRMTYAALPPVLVLAERPTLADAVRLIKAGAGEYLENTVEARSSMPTRVRDLIRWHFLHQAIAIAKGEQLLVEKRLRSLQESLLAAERIAKLGSWYWTLEGGSTWSDGLHRLLGTSPERHPPTLETFLAFTHPEDRETVEALVLESTHHRAPASATFRIVTERGETRHLEALVQRALESSRDLVRPGIVLRDVTESRIHQAELVAAKEAAEIASSSKADFLARMSHEIRTPMNSIIGMLDLALDTELDEEQRDYVDMATSSAKSLLHLLNDVLDYSKIEAGRLELEAAPVDLPNVLETSLRALAQRAFDRGLELVLDLDPKMPELVRGDAHRMAQVFVNLVANALKFTERGEIVIAGSAGPVLEGRAEFHFEVADSGIGISPEKQALIFEAFSQADETVTRRFGGTGLGLAICRQLAELLGGRIWVESREGLGSTFHFLLELEVLAETKLPSLARGAGRRLLVVEDHPRSRTATERALTTLGYEVSCAESPKEALGLVEGGLGFAGMVVDVTLGGVEPNEFLGALLAAHGPAVVVQLDPRVGRAEHAFGGRSFPRIHKPFSTATLARGLEAAFAGAPEVFRPPSRPAVRSTFPAPLTILVAEDNPMNQIVVRTMLQRMGHQVVLVDNGAHALETLGERADIDLVLMDVQMPVMDGLEAVRRLRTKETGSGLPVIALTAQALTGDREACLRAGMNAYLTKPLDRGALEETIRELTVRSPRAPVAIDRRALAERVGTDPCILGQLAGLFVSDAATLLTDIRRVLAEREGPHARSLHTLRGMLQNVCAGLGADCARRLERLVEALRWDEATALFAELEDEVTRIGTALEEASRVTIDPSEVPPSRASAGPVPSAR